MSDLDVRLEVLRISFYDMAEQKRMKGDKSPITITEVEGDEAFEAWVDAGMPDDDDWEELK